MLKVHLMEYSLLCFLISLGVSLGVLRLVLARVFVGWIPTYLQSNHQSRETPIPHFGGFAMIAGVVVVAVVGWIRGAHLAAPSSTTGLLVGMGGMFLVGFLRDIVPIRGTATLALQVGVGLLAVFSGLRMDSFHLPGYGFLEFSDFFATILTICWLVVCTNVIGLVDGIDGLAGGISLMVLGLTFDVAYGSGDAGVALFIAGIGGGLVSLLWYNFPPAKIRLGNCGTYFLGMALGGLSIEVSHKGAVQFAFLAPVLAMGLPFLDMGVVLIRRVVRGLPLFRLDQRHIHNRLQEQGLTPGQTLMVLYGVSACFLTGGFVVMWTQGQLIPLVIGLTGILVLLFLNQLNRRSGSTRLNDAMRDTSLMRREIRNAELLGRWLTLQARRVETFDELWERFCFVLNDVKLQGAEIQGSNFQRYYSAGLATGSGSSSRHRIVGTDGESVQILIQGDGSKTPPHLFYALAEISAEAFQNAWQVWQERQRGCGK